MLLPILSLLLVVCVWRHAEKMGKVHFDMIAV